MLEEVDRWSLNWSVVLFIADCHDLSAAVVKFSLFDFLV
ncbi:hypothetical protein A2U01_0037373 [Trifolium medium]|uniref:Uncharacterized protein n=1 Tax=Trifolium medium TaxID=97028 RepID=A0A392PVY4_9FABA|nr:hypothetical protein [Trifolium medium]